MLLRMSPRNVAFLIAAVVGSSYASGALSAQEAARVVEQHDFGKV
jgi:hypothetical protein